MPASIAKLAILLTTDTSGMTRGFAQARFQTTDFSSQLVALAGRFATVTTALTVLGAEVRAARWMVDLSEQARAAEIRFEALTGSLEKARAVMATVHDFGDGLFEDMDIAAASRRLLAGGVGAGELPDTLRVLGNLSLGTGQSLEQLAETLVRIGEDGTVSFKDLNGLSKEGIPIIDELAKQLGVARFEIRKLAEEGRIGLPEVAEALRAMTEEGGRFGSQIDKSRDTLTGEWKRLWDAIEDRARGAGDEIGKIPHALLRSFNDFILGADKATSATRGFEEAMRRLDEGPLQKAFEDSKKRMEDAAKAIEDVRKKGEALADSLRTPAEIAKDKFAELDDLLRNGAISLDIYQRGVKRIGEEFVRATESKTRLDTAVRPAVGAALAGTSAGFSAVQEGKREMQRLVEGERKAAEQRAKMIEKLEAIRSLIRPTPPAPPPPVARF